MNASELATKMLEWESLYLQLKKLEDEISDGVLEIGKTQTVGNVRATFSNGRKEYLYEEAYNKSGIVAPQEVMNAHTKISYDWRSICSALGIDATNYFIQKSGPSVSIKLMEKG